MSTEQTFSAERLPDGPWREFRKTADDEQALIYEPI